jgi:hypothetical protein
MNQYVSRVCVLFGLLFGLCPVRLLPVQSLLIDFHQSLAGDPSTDCHRAEGIGSVDDIKSEALATLLG